jgi:hypothetical protein
MGLGRLVKNAYAKSASFVKKEETFINASVLASLCCLTNAATTKAGMVHQSVLHFHGGEQISYYLMSNYGLNGGLALESLVSISIAVPLAFTLNKLMREEWKPGAYIKSKLGIGKSKESRRELPGSLKMGLGTAYFYILSAYSLYAAFNNVYIDYMIKGIINGRTRLPF